MHQKTVSSAFAAALLFAAASVALAQQPQGDEVRDRVLGEQPGEGEVVPPAPEPSPPLTISGEVRYVTAYFSDGYNFADDGLILQPQATVAYRAYEGQDLTITPFFNVWANVTDQNYPKTDKFDELDLTAGVTAACGRWVLGAQYIFYTSPADTFQDIHEVGVSVGIDDSDLTPLPFALNPYAAVYYEFKDKGGQDGTSAELGVEPRFKVLGENVPLTLALPVIVGFSLDDFYFDGDGGNSPVGYVGLTVALRYDFGDHWYVTGAGRYLYLTADSTQDFNDGDEDQVIGLATVGFAY